MDISEEKRLEKLESFILSSKMNDLAKNNSKGNIFLNAGRGNPNWINKKARLAFNRLVEFGILESERTMNVGDLAGYIEKKDITSRFLKFLNSKNNIDSFLIQTLNYAKNRLHLNTDEFVKELADGVIGNNYPEPNIILKNTKVILNQFLQSALYNSEELAESTEIFPTEGGTAAIVYIFASLKENKLIKAGDKIAINTPIFTPYIEIPTLHDYQMVEVDLNSSEEDNWAISKDEIDKLLNPDIKAFIVVNPSNPGSKSLSPDSLAEIQEVIKKRPDLMIITDDVYGTFVNDFQSIYSVAPYNTLLVYSYSKLYGATGWRVGLIAANQNNVFDKLINDLPNTDKNELTERYSKISLTPEKFSFIYRIVADSRSVSLSHTAGLSTPQQIMEVLFSMTHLLEENNDIYIEESKKIVKQRYNDLHDSLNIKKDSCSDNSRYYSLIDIYKIAQNIYGNDFAIYLEDNFEEADFLINLASKNGVVLMDGVGFGTSDGNLRVSQANLPTKDYKIIGDSILKLLKEYHDEYNSK
ncbi:bifunctional aspartate transaminase/aspartate 4-decarboxylase [Companilactobacillus metriopterae]|uniref:bifunctional aspartate transaminase/aspartate 4-decarboxylase n=1 Tax=Companilactobacillus metriopterae TaxID=1909267 RepID=UPI00100BCF23|nr:bifunctional aspartate transaminase/aspartate 4-decarboxylase [Companilactobacillus metriopterae]